MSDPHPPFAKAREWILAFRDARDWAQFHTPRNVAAALAIEAAELQAELLWKSDAETKEFLDSKPGHGRASDGVADVLVYALLFCHEAGIAPRAEGVWGQLQGPMALGADSGCADTIDLPVSFAGAVG